MPMQQAQARMFLVMLRREVEDLAAGIETAEADAVLARRSGNLDRQAELLVRAGALDRRMYEMHRMIARLLKRFPDVDDLAPEPA
ncbi:hypothetical protein ABIC28_002410 [Rhodococcus sp. PvR044]|jgi:hypothetical protein|uniref:hypothetical protein n=1 Tax=Rhodococcus TaxID=1827 RepID=UPI000BC849A7|nr:MULTISPECIES: hypothetical protein [unclassified Rhodococcus (in: high G+C Gram-positive bacteria)]MBP1160114.1 hypothetical protein [Rhodococcus sp. PvR099]PTR41331.1 hypothetical protein C8K38_112214 [Rhodococcus sp. OK611]SNX92153.1 hypothetical protein SAMN05447004_112214 [Rhodococcus sp. OK270]